MGGEHGTAPRVVDTTLSCWSSGSAGTLLLAIGLGLGCCVGPGVGLDDHIRGTPLLVSESLSRVAHLLQTGNHTQHPRVETGFGLDDPYGSLPASDAPWFWDSIHPLPYIATLFGHIIMEPSIHGQLPTAWPCTLLSSALLFEDARGSLCSL